MHALSISEIRPRLRQHQAVHVDPSGVQNWASVVLLLRDLDASVEGPELLFIRRARKEGDPWSGHMAFPGGRQETADATLYATAVRETAEEVGIDLDGSASFVAPLDDQISPLREGRASLVIRPQVFVCRRPIELTINEEVERVYWFPLTRLLDPQYRGTMSYRWKGSELELPVIRIEDADIWGLSLRMLECFFRIALARQD